MPRIKYNEKGEEICDPTRPEIPLGFKKPESLAEQVRRLVRSEQLAAVARASGHETFEEADDFEVGDDFDPRSPYEEVFDPTAREAPEVEAEVSRRRKAKEEQEEEPTPAKKAKAAKAPKREKPASGSGEPEGEAPSED